MSQVLFYAVTAAQYAAIPTKNPNALYFITDGNRIYKGAIPYTHPVETVTSFPASGEAGTLFIHKTTYEAKIWDGSAWSTVSLPVITSIGASPTNTQLPTAQAVKNYVDSEIVNVNSGISGAVSNVDTRLRPSRSRSRRARAKRWSPPSLACSTACPTTARPAS